jgi:hypothetical protein
MSGLVIKPDRLCNERCRRSINLLVNGMVRRPKCSPRRSDIRRHVQSLHCAVAGLARIKLLAARRRGICESMIRNAANRFLNFGVTEPASAAKLNIGSIPPAKLGTHCGAFLGPTAGTHAENRACAFWPRTLLKRHTKDIVPRAEISPTRPAKGSSRGGPLLRLKATGTSLNGPCHR